MRTQDEDLTMNLAQKIGALQLRVWELEEQLGERSQSPLAQPSVVVAPPNHPRRYGMAAKVRELLRERGPMSIDELTAALGEVKRSVVANNVATKASTGKLLRARNDRGIAVYSLPEGA